MRHIRQQGKDDCGVACVAMLAGVAYATAEAAFQFKGRSRRTTSRQIINAMARLGYIALRKRLCTTPPMLPQHRAIIKYIGPHNTPNRFHWRAWDPKERYMHDPVHKRPTPVESKLGRHCNETHFIDFEARG